jgi:hypothetical protein
MSRAGSAFFLASSAFETLIVVFVYAIVLAENIKRLKTRYQHATSAPRDLRKSTQLGFCLRSSGSKNGERRVR